MDATVSAAGRDGAGGPVPRPRCAGCGAGIRGRLLVSRVPGPGVPDSRPGHPDTRTGRPDTRTGPPDTRAWHPRCARCADCGRTLPPRGFSRDGRLYCPADFYRRFGARCSACGVAVPRGQAVRRAPGRVFHVSCFRCSACGAHISTGQLYHLLPDGRLVCHHDYAAELVPGAGGPVGGKRPRTTISGQQLEALRAAYSQSPKPSRGVREQLTSLTGLHMRVVQVWFQNRRAKEKRLKRDAGRQRWASDERPGGARRGGRRAGQGPAASSPAGPRAPKEAGPAMPGSGCPGPEPGQNGAGLAPCQHGSDPGRSGPGLAPRQHGSDPGQHGAGLAPCQGSASTWVSEATGGF